MELRDSIIFLVGAGIGAGISFALTKRSIESKCKEEIESMRLRYKAESGTVTEALNDMKDIVAKKYFKQSELEDDSIVFTRTEDGESNDEEMDDLAESEYPAEEPDIRKDPYPISNEEYFEGDDPGIGKRALIYYAGDDTLVDETTEEIQELSQIGIDNLGYFGKYEENRLFIRNEPLCEDYEVIFEEGSFHQLDEEG